MSLQKCVRCGLPETYETITFGSDGVCNVCNQIQFKTSQVDWRARAILLDTLVDEYRGKGKYDCIVPFSGGKDSTFTLYHIVEKLNLKPLVVQFDHGFLRGQLNENNARTLKRLGVDFVSFQPNWKIVKLLMLESLNRKGDFCWHCHTGVFSFPMHVALMFETPLIFWGEPSSEYTAYYEYSDDEIETVDEERFNRFINLGINAEDMARILGDKADVSLRDLWPYQYPQKQKLGKLGVRSVCLGSFIPWDTRKQSDIIKAELGWCGDEVEGMPPEIYDYEKIECYMQGVRDYLKYLKRGYSRVSQMMAIDRRAGVVSDVDADRYVSDFEGRRPPSLDIFLNYVGLTEEEFNNIAKRMAVWPHEPDFSAIADGVRTHDFSDWYTEE